MKFMKGFFFALILLGAGHPVWAHATTADAPAIVAEGRRLFAQPLFATARTRADEDASLLAVLERFAAAPDGAHAAVIEGFLERYPSSPWAASLYANLGNVYLSDGYFSSAIGAFDSAWRDGASLADPEQKAVVDRALGRLLDLQARLGHEQELGRLLKQIGGRKLAGSAGESLVAAREGLWNLRREPDMSRRCGVAALESLLLSADPSTKAIPGLESVKASRRGMNFADLQGLANRYGFSSSVVFEDSTRIPVPSIVHWKTGHFAAILAENAGRYRIQDPAAGGELWMTAAAILHEGSGYYLAPAAHSAGRTVAKAEAGKVWGAGNTSANDPDATTPCDSKDVRPCGLSSNGMPQYAFHSMLASLNIEDAPIGYTPPIGPSVPVVFTYNQREANQPATFGYFNLGQKWTLNWLTYIQDNPGSPGSSVKRYVSGGGARSYTGYVASTGAFSPETNDGSVLVMTSASPVTYERRLADGSKEVYSRSNGVTTYPRSVFLTSVVDPAGNAVSLSYDSQLRLTAITDSIGQVTTFQYTNANPLLVTGVADPFGRTALISYDASGRLSSIQDVIGMTSTFAYDSTTFINGMTTPYGTTSFAHTEAAGGDATERSVQATDPLGWTEKTEYKQGVSTIPFSESLVPSGMTTFNSYINYRDSYYWDKSAYAGGPSNYNVVPRIKHFLHMASNSNYTSRVLESVKYPNENRIWLDYQGQSAGYTGTFDHPTHIGRVLDDGTTQLTTMSYNAQGRLTKRVDPSGRETDYTYATNGIDLVTVQQKNASGFDTTAQYTYNTQHEPLSYTDAAGQTTQFTYNTKGQLATVVDPLSQTVTYNYDTKGYLVSVKDPLGNLQRQYTYDGYGRVATQTDAGAYAIAYNYDALDRLTKATFPDGTTHTYTWDKLELGSEKDRESKVTTYTHDALRNLTSVTDPMGQVTTLQYAQNDLLDYVKDPSGNFTFWSLDYEGRVSFKEYSDYSEEHYTYDGAGRLSTVTDPMNQVKTYTYYADNQVKGVSYTNAVHATPSVSYSYDPYYSRLTGMTDGLGTSSFTYYPTGMLGALMLHQETGPYGAAYLYGYDALGRLASQGVNGGAGSDTYTYDALGRMITDVNPLGTFAYTYLGATNQPIGRTLNGTSGFSVGAVYDPNTGDRQLHSLTYSNTAGSAVRTFTYTHSPEHRLLSAVDQAAGQSAVTLNYAYDDAKRLTAVSGSQTEAYGYDSTDNITSYSAAGTSYTGAINNLNQLALINGNNVTYDADGHVLADGTNTYSWDAEGRLVGVTVVANGHSSTFGYDGLGRRLDYVDQGSEARYIGCGPTVCGTTGTTANGSSAYRSTLFAQGDRATRLTTIGAPIVHYYVQDQLGSVTGTLSSTGASPTVETYSAYGISPYNGIAGIGVGYAGLFEHSATGLLLADYRVYSPKLGRWLSRDPIGENGGVNLYAYVEGNPLNAIDPLGLMDLNIPGATGEVSVHANPGRDVVGDPQSMAEHGPAHFHIGGRTGPEVSLIDFKPVDDAAARAMTKKQLNFCKALTNQQRNLIRKRAISVYKRGYYFVRLSSGAIIRSTASALGGLALITSYTEEFSDVQACEIEPDLGACPADMEQMNIPQDDPH